MYIVQATSLNYFCFLFVFQESSIVSKFHFFLPKDKRLLVGAATLSITTFSITTLSIKGLFARLRLNETQHDWPSVEKHSAINAECRILFVVMLSVIMLDVV